MKLKTLRGDRTAAENLVSEILFYSDWRFEGRRKKCEEEKRADDSSWISYHCAYFIGMFF